MTALDYPEQTNETAMPGLPHLPDAMHAAVQHQWTLFKEAAAEAQLPAAVHPDIARVLVQVWACSDFVAHSCIRDPSLLLDLIASGDLIRAYGPNDYAEQLTAVCAQATDEAALHAALRGLRRREMVRIAWRDLAGWADLFETMRDLSALAEACLATVLRTLDSWQSQEAGRPCNARGKRQSLVVLGMGKLGARELNFSSDIDLIFAYPEEGTTRGGRTSISNAQYFERLGQRLIQALNATTVDGFVFRVDMRLRPFGDSGPLALNFDAMEDYYQSHGREWERYAMIKARVVAGDPRAGRELMKRLHPFIYRRYLDFGAFQSLRDMKQLIVREVERKGLADNVKLGGGGIREVEFIGQAFQLIRGGRLPELQERRIVMVLEALRLGGLLPEFVVRELQQAYVFLRNTEHCLQMWRDEQRHSLPTKGAGRLRLAYAMGFADWDDFAAVLARHRRRVRNHFEQVFAAPQGDGESGSAPVLTALWQGRLAASAAHGELEALGYDDAAQALEYVRQLRESYSCRVLSAHGRERLDRLMPLLLGAVARAAHPTETLHRVLGLVEAIAQRTAYLALLVEHPMALSQLVKLCAASPWIAEFLTRHPLLLDGLLDPRHLYAPLDQARLREELAQRLDGVPDDDLEQQMDALRHFKQTHALRVAAADVAGHMPLMVVSDHLTAIAEVVLERTLDLAYQHLVRRHGRPSGPTRRRKHAYGFVIVGYGKLGGIELGYSSDLDLVFLHAGDAEGTTGGSVPVPNSVFFARLGQRIIHMLSAHTSAGVLYEVDMRLRPSGSAGMLVSTLPAFREYQSEGAWTWEHQALVRARAVAGDSQLASEFDAIRRETLAQRRAPAELRAQVRDMRARMRAELGSRGEEVFDIKQDAGGIADIEFMVQYCVLRWSWKHAGLLQWSDNVRLLAAIAQAGLLPAADATFLTDAYRAYRAKVHRLALQDQPARVAGDTFAEFRAGVTRIWEKLMEQD